MKRFVVKSTSTIAMLALASLPLFACGGDDDGGPASVDAGGAPEGTYNHFVNDTISVPQSSAQTTAFGLDIDNDAHHRVDNALGGILSALKQQNVDIQKAVTDSVTSGKLILLHSIQATSLDSANNVGWKVLLGDPTDAPPAFDGSDMFTVSATSPTDGLLTGQIAGGSFQGGPGNVTIALSLTTGDPIRVKLVGARIKANLTADGCTDGILGGAITEMELNDAVIPGIRTLMNNSVNDDGPAGTTAPADCPATGSCAPAANGDPTTCVDTYGKCITSTSKTILDLFDKDHNVDITIDEIKNSTIIKALLASDVDLFNDTTGAFEPRGPEAQGKKDSLSVGIAFTCKKGTFTVTGE
jgi:hypothetical protein